MPPSDFLRDPNDASAIWQKTQVLKDSSIIHCFDAPIALLNISPTSYHLLRFSSFDKAHTALQELSKIPCVPPTSPFFVCSDGTYVGLKKFGFKSLNEALALKEYSFFDHFEKKSSTSVQTIPVKIQPSSIYIRIIKSVLQISSALKGSQWSLDMDGKFILLKPATNSDDIDDVFFIGFCAYQQDRNVDDGSKLINLLDYIHNRVGGDDDVMNPFIRVVKSFGCGKDGLSSENYEHLLSDPTLLTPIEKAAFMVELGGMLESKTCQQFVPICPAFSTFSTQLEENYHLQWLVYADQLIGSKKYAGMSFYTPSKNPGRADESTDWRAKTPKQSISGRKEESSWRKEKPSYSEQSLDTNPGRADESTDWRAKIPKKSISGRKEESSWRKEKPSYSGQSLDTAWWWKDVNRDATEEDIYSMSSNVAEVVVPFVVEKQLVVYICKLFRNTAAHRWNLMVMFKGALDCGSMEDLQKVFEMLFPDHMRQLLPYYNMLKAKHDEKAKIIVLDNTSRSFLKPREENVSKRPLSWEEMLLIDQMQQQKQLSGLGQEYDTTKMSLQLVKEKLDDSIKYGLK